MSCLKTASVDTMRLGQEDLNFMQVPFLLTLTSKFNMISVILLGFFLELGKLIIVYVDEYMNNNSQESP